MIDKLLYDGYSTISLGYAGLYEMCVRMTGKSHTSDEGKEFALKVMQKLNDKCNEWKAAENISYSVYGTPMESTTYKFAKCLQKRFGIIPGVTDKNYITNSYHVHEQKRSMHSANWHLSQNSRNYLQAERSATLKYQTCRIIFQPSYP